MFLSLRMSLRLLINIIFSKFWNITINKKIKNIDCQCFAKVACIWHEYLIKRRLEIINILSNFVNNFVNKINFNKICKRNDCLI